MACCRDLGNGSFDAVNGGLSHCSFLKNNFALLWGGWLYTEQHWKSLVHCILCLPHGWTQFLYRALTQEGRGFEKTKSIFICDEKSRGLHKSHRESSRILRSVVPLYSCLNVFKNRWDSRIFLVAVLPVKHSWTSDSVMKWFVSQDHSLVHILYRLHRLWKVWLFNNAVLSAEVNACYVLLERLKGRETTGKILI